MNVVTLIVLLALYGFYRFVERMYYHKQNAEYRRHNYNIPRQNELTHQVFSTMKDFEGNSLISSEKYPFGYAYAKSNGAYTGISKSDIDELVRERLEAEGFEFFQM